MKILKYMGTICSQTGWISVRKETICGLLILVILSTTAVYVKALRIPRPARFTLPWTEEQITDLSNTLEDIFNMQQGRFELDIVTSSKTNAKNGEIWILNDSGTFKLEFKAGDAVRTITP